MAARTAALLRVVATSTSPAPSVAHVALLFDLLDGEEHALGRHRRVETNREFVFGDTADGILARRPHCSRQVHRRLSDAFRSVNRRGARRRIFQNADVERGGTSRLPGIL